MRRPRLTLPLFHPRRRLRDRMLAAMLVVGLLPAAAFVVLMVTGLHGITQATVNGAVSSYVDHQEGAFQTGLDTTARTGLNAGLQKLRVQVQQLASSLAGAAATPSPSPPATASPSATASASATASPRASPTPDEAGAAAAPTVVGSAVGGVSQISTGVSPATAELLVGSAPAGSPASVITRAGPLWKLSSFAGDQLDKAAVKVGSFADAVWIMDSADAAVWISPGDVQLPAQGLATNPQGMPLGMLSPLQAPSPGTSPSPGASAPSWLWTAPYQNPLHGNDWEVTAYAAAGHGLLVGADVPLAQYTSLIPQAPAEPGSSPLLLDDASRVIATSPTGKQFTQALKVGSRLPAPAGRAGPAVLAALGSAASGGAAQSQIEASVGGTDRIFFVAPVTDPGWILVDSVPKQNFQLPASALSPGINGALTTIFRDAIWIAAGLLVASILFATVLSRFVVAPVRALTRSAERLAEGVTDEEVPSQGRDEVGDLADSLERMRREINASREVILAASRELEHKVSIRTAELSARNEELLALNELAGSLSRSLDPEAILAGALDAVRAVLPTTAGRGYRLGPEGLLTAGRAEAGQGDPLLEVIAAAAIDDNHLVTRRDGDGVLIGLPMGTGAGPLGALGLRAMVTPGVEMTALLMAIGNQVGLALSTARLSEEGRAMAVLEERARLAREIHDTLAQQLTGIVIQLEAAQALVNRDPNRSVPALASAQELARSALAEARRSVWDLRPAPLTSTGLVAAAESEVERFRRRTGIAARLRAERMLPPPALRPQSEVTLLRITQQALANIAAHSGASRVTVRLRNLGDQVELTVKDNGHGFDTSALPLGSFGLVGMAERARIAGGTFEVASVAGRGTTITVQLPVPADADKHQAAPPTAVPV